jgi:SAM-dependent methyltransferase
MSAAPAENGQSKAALRGEPSYVWRAGQKRRLAMILQAAKGRAEGDILVNGCGVGMYAEHLAPYGGQVVGLDIEYDRVRVGHQRGMVGLTAAGEKLPFPGESFDLILSHEVLEHVQDDRLAIREMVRTLRPAGRIVLFVPNRGYPFETHGVYWQGEYHFGNIPLVNYLPRTLRDRLAPHVRVYTSRDLDAVFQDLPVRVIDRTVIFGAYDNLIARWPRLGKGLRGILQGLEGTPLRALGLSHFWVVEKIAP